MPRTKRVWRTMLPEAGEVNWACYNPETLEPNASTRNGPWARMVRLPSIAPDGRELEMILTPTEALAYANRIIRQANAINENNERHNNGFAPDAVREEGS